MHDLFAGNATVATWSIRVLHTMSNAHLCLALSRQYRICHALDSDPVNMARGCVKSQVLIIVHHECYIDCLSAAIGTLP